MKVAFELWSDEELGEPFTLCLASSGGDKARLTLSQKARLLKTFEAESYFDVMTQYYAYQGWGTYTSEYEQDHWPLIDQLGHTQDTK